MGTGKAYALHETDETRAAGKAHEFEEIIAKVETAGGEIVHDEEVPLFIEMGADEAEVGIERTVEFNLNRTDFRLTRKEENMRISGDGINKQLEPMSSPRVKIQLKKKPDTSDDWEIVDMEDMF